MERGDDGRESTMMMKYMFHFCRLLMWDRRSQRSVVRCYALLCKICVYVCGMCVCVCCTGPMLLSE